MSWAGPARLCGHAVLLAVAAWLFLAGGDARASERESLARAMVDQGVALLSAGDIQAARQLFKQAAQAGLPDAQNVYGHMLLDGLGGAADATEAQKWIMRAALAGFAPSQARLAALYLEGRGLPRDPAWAYYWAELSLTAPALSAQERALADRTAKAAAALVSLEKRKSMDASLAGRRSP